MTTVTDPAGYRKRIEDCLGAKFEGDKLGFHIGAEDVEDAKLKKKLMVQQQKELRQIKREINQDMKTIRADYKQQSANAQPSFLGVFVGGKGYAKNQVAKQRREIKQKREAALQPYEKIKLKIDSLILYLDRAKLAFTEYIDQET